jgi:signal transduction histidine kinase
LATKAVNPETRRSKLERKERAILDAARAVFVEHGFDGARVSEIARRAQIGEGTIYSYYESKAELMLAVLQQFWDGLTREAEAVMASVAADGFFDRLRALVLIILIVSVTGAGAIAVLMSMFIRRWVLVPLEILREGAERLGRGDFEHRIPVTARDEFGRLGDEFNEMAGLIKAMQDERVERERMAAMGEMARRIVHNLRTPLAGIRNLAETTRSELEPGSDLIGVQDRIMSSVDRFEGWLSEMLRASSPIELDPRPFSPRAIVGSVVESHVDAARARGLTIRADLDGLPEEAVGDPAHIEHALTALVSNAVEFGPHGSEVRIEGGCGGGYWSVRVVDSGPGVPEDLRAAIFRPYFTTRQGGTGIGLALVKRVADQHGGTITVRSPVDADSGVGTAFELRLPTGAGDG